MRARAISLAAGAALVLISSASAEPALYPSLLKVPIRQNEIPTGITVTGVLSATRSQVLAISAELYSARLAFSVTAAVVIETNKGSVVLVLMPNTNDATLFLNLVVPDDATDWVNANDLLGIKNPKVAVISTGHDGGWAKIGTVIIRPVAKAGSAGLTAQLMSLAIEHLRDAERALSS